MESHQRIRRRLKLRDLDTLQAIADAGSMAKAAERLAMSQPAISRAIAELEHTLGVSLFERSAQGVEPTIYARILLERGKAIFDELRQGLDEIEFRRDPTVGELRVGVTEPLTPILSAVIGRMSEQYPRVAFQVVVADTGALHHQLRQRSLDLALTRMSEPDAEKDLRTEVLFDDELTVMAEASNDWTRRERVELSDLVHEPWALPSADMFLGGFVRDAFRARGLEVPFATVATPSVQMRIALVLTGRFLTMLPSFMLRLPSAPPSLRAVPVALPDTRRPIGLVMLKGRSLSPLASLFIDQARATAPAVHSQ